MTTVTLRGVPISFPFEPYQIQKDYMEKVLDCLQNQTNGVLESPTGTGKTLSLLCSTLAWLELKKAQMQAQLEIAMPINENMLDQFNKQSQTGLNMPMRERLPRIIYASRTHSQLTQVMQEMKKTAYKHMSAVILGSRDQLCIHPDIEREENRSTKITMCLLKIKTRTCKFHTKVEQCKGRPEVSDVNIMDIEDLVKLGKRCGFCPFYMSRELKNSADIIFMPYNYLLDPFIRKTMDIQLSNTIVILDEAHNVESVCEDSASLQLKSSDVALAIEEVTAIMKMFSEDNIEINDSPKDFDAEDLCNLKSTLMNLEQEIDKIDFKKESNITLDGTFMFDLLRRAGITFENFQGYIKLISNIVQLLATINEGPFQLKGNSLQLIQDIMSIVFFDVSNDFKDKVKKCYKVYIQPEVIKKNRTSENWLTKATTITRQGGKIINYWCFSAGIGMNLLMKHGLRSLILTSGTLAPLSPLIAELELKVGVRLENPHIVGNDQVCVKILPVGPDNIELNSSFQNRDNPKYINSLGMTIYNISKVVPHGMLIFFPSYPIMTKCTTVWQQLGIWANITAIKPIYVEPKEKNAFNAAMNEYYSKVKDPYYKGSIFMGVCRGKVSEGLDFCDANGRAVLITGLPYPPFLDPRVVLKKKYLELCHIGNKEYLTGQQWYSMEASRAVNQAIGRVIRHKDDYGAIILLDCRFQSDIMKRQMSSWLRNHIKVFGKFGPFLGDLRLFFRTAEAKFKNPTSNFECTQTYSNMKLEMPNSSKTFSESSDLNSLPEVVIHKRTKTINFPLNSTKRLKLTVIPNSNSTTHVPEFSAQNYITMVKSKISEPLFKEFTNALYAYNSEKELDVLLKRLDDTFKNTNHLKYLIIGLEHYITGDHKLLFSDYCRRNGLLAD